MARETRSFPRGGLRKNKGSARGTRKAIADKILDKYRRQDRKSQNPHSLQAEAGGQGRERGGGTKTGPGGGGR